MDNRLEHPRRKIKRIKRQNDTKNDNDDSKFQFYKNLIQRCIIKLKNEQDKLVYAAWLFQLDKASAPLRIKLAQLMLVSLQNLHSFSVFSNFPPSDLASLEINAEEDTVKLLKDLQTQTDTIEKNRDVLQETKSERQVAVSSDLCSYVAVKTTKNLVQSFFVRSDTLIHTWNNPQKIILPSILDSNQWEKSLRRLDLECQQDKCNPVTLKDGCESIMNMEQVSKEIAAFRWNEHSVLANNRPKLITSHINVDQDIGNQPITQRSIDETAKNIVQNKSFPGYKMLNPKAYSTIIVANAELVLNTTKDTTECGKDQTSETFEVYCSPENETENCCLPQNETSMRTTNSDTTCRSTRRSDGSERQQPSSSCAARKNACKRLSKTCNDNKTQLTPKRSSSCKRRNKTLHDRPSTSTLCCDQPNNERGQTNSPLSTLMEISPNCGERAQAGAITHGCNRSSNGNNRTDKCNKNSCVPNRNGQATLNDSSNYNWTMSSADLTTNKGGSPQTPLQRTPETSLRHSNAQKTPNRVENLSNCSEQDQAGVISCDDCRASNGSNRVSDRNNSSCVSHRNGQASLNNSSNYNWTMSSADLTANRGRSPQTPLRRTRKTSQSRCNVEQNPSSQKQNHVCSRGRHVINISSDSRYDETCGGGAMEESVSANPGTDHSSFRASHSPKYSCTRRRSRSVPNTACGHQRSPLSNMSREHNVSCSTRSEDKSGHQSFNVSNGNNMSPGMDHSLYRPLYDDNWDPDVSQYSTFRDRTNQHVNASTFVTSEQQPHCCGAINRRSSLLDLTNDDNPSLMHTRNTNIRNEMTSSRPVSLRRTDRLRSNSRYDSEQADGTRGMVEAWLDGRPDEGCARDSVVSNRFQRNSNQTSPNPACSAQMDRIQDRIFDVTNDTTEPSLSQYGYKLYRDETISRALHNDSVDDSRWDADVSEYSTFRNRNRRWINDSGHVVNERHDYSLPRQPSLFDLYEDHGVDPSAGVISDHRNYKNENLNSTVWPRIREWDLVNSPVSRRACRDREYSRSAPLRNSNIAARTVPRVTFDDDCGGENQDVDIRSMQMPINSFSSNEPDDEDVDIRTMQMPINSFSSTELDDENVDIRNIEMPIDSFSSTDPEDSRRVHEMSNTSFQNTNNSNFSQICEALRRRRR